MYRIITFVGFVIILMENNGLQKLIKYTFAEQNNIDRKIFFSINGSALRFVVVKLLRGLGDNMVFSDNLDQFFKKVASKSALVEH